MAIRKKKRSKRRSSKARSVDEVWRKEPETVKRFLALHRAHQDLCVEVEYILRKVLARRGIEVASISSRAKTLNSFLEKIQRKGYADPFGQITDFSGARVVCLYANDVSRIADIIAREFRVVEDTDKMDDMSSDQFGYLARHIIVKLGKASSGARYDDLKERLCEIQVRTVLQDAWAIIQHHMVYKRESQAPHAIQRRLNSLAGLLETADDQFERIRDQRLAYVGQVQAGSESALLARDLNLDSFREYLLKSHADKPVESWDGQMRMAFDWVKASGVEKVRDLDKKVKAKELRTQELIERIDSAEKIYRTEDGSIPSNLYVLMAVVLASSDWEAIMKLPAPWVEVIKEYVASSDDEDAG